MPSPAFAVIVNGGSGVTADKPTLAYVSYGAFTVTNFGPQLAYTPTGGSLTSGVFNVAASTGSGTLFATSPKGSVGATVTAYRQAKTSDWVSTGPDVFSYSSDGSNGGTYYAQDQWNPSDGSPAGYYAMTRQGYYVNRDYSGAGYTFNNSTNEWWRIV